MRKELPDADRVVRRRRVGDFGIDAGPERIECDFSRTSVEIRGVLEIGESRDSRSSVVEHICQACLGWKVGVWWLLARGPVKLPKQVDGAKQVAVEEKQRDKRLKLLKPRHSIYLGTLVNGPPRDVALLVLVQLTFE